MKSLAILFTVLLGAGAPVHAAGEYDLVFQIAPESGMSSDSVTICRVTVANYSGDPLDGRQIGFEASALDNGVVVERERGRFQGVVRNGEKAETLIGFNGAFQSFAIAAATAPSRNRSGRSGRGRKSGSGKVSKPAGKRRAKKAK